MNHFTLSISGYLLAGAIIGPTLAMVQWAAVRTQRSAIRAAPHLKYSGPSPVTKMLVIQGQLPGLASCPPVILLLLSCSAHFGLMPHDAKEGRQQPAFQCSQMLLMLQCLLFSGFAVCENRAKLKIAILYTIFMFSSIFFSFFIFSSENYTKLTFIQTGSVNIQQYFLRLRQMS